MELSESVERRFSQSLTRMVSVELFGFACYELTAVGLVKPGSKRCHSYTHRGIVGTVEDANKWLAGDSSTVPTKIFTDYQCEVERGE